MTKQSLIWTCACCGSLILSSAGCRKQTAGPSALSVEKVPEAVEAAFKESPEATRKVAADVIAGIRSEDPPGALLALDSLHSRPELTPEQRLAVFQASQALLDRLRAAAAKGDKNAEAALEQHRATK